MTSYGTISKAATNFLINGRSVAEIAGQNKSDYDKKKFHTVLFDKITKISRFCKVALKKFPLERSWCASGPYAPDVVNEVVCSRDKYLYGAYSVLNVMSHLNYHPECFAPDIKIEDFLTEEGIRTGIVETIASRKVGNKDLVKIVVDALGTRLSKLFKSEACKRGEQLYDMVDRCAKAERQIDGWSPELPISFYHLHADECVPVESMLEVKRLWGHLPNVTFEDDMTAIDEIPNRMGHAHSGGVFHRRLLNQIF